MSSSQIQTRTRILQSTWKLLEANPPKGVRMSDIAKDAGLSRQALYLHFPTRSELLVATTLHVDDVLKVEGRLQSSREAKNGIERLNAYVEAWGNYIPEIYGVGRALMAVQDTDDAARLAWSGRMLALREGCLAAVKQLKQDGDLLPELSTKQATDMFWGLLSVRMWEHYIHDCKWSQKRYIDVTQKMVKQVLLGHA